MKCIILLAAVYGTLANGELVKAPTIVDCDGYWRGSETLSERQANALGYKMVVDERPTCGSNEYAVAVGWAESNRIERIYNILTVVPTPRRWTPLSIKRSASRLGQWDALKAFLTAANAYDDFVMAQYEAENDEQFTALMDAARQQFGSETVDAILNNAEVEQ